MRTKLFLLLFLVLCLQGQALHTVRLKGTITSKPLYLKTEKALIVMDYELFLNVFASKYSKTEIYDSDRQIVYKEDGKPYRTALKNYLDSLYALNDSVFIDPSHPVYRHTGEEKSTEDFVPSEEIRGTIMKLIRSGKVKMQEEGTAITIRKVSIKRKTDRIRLLFGVLRKYWVVTDKANGTVIFSQKIGHSLGAYY